MSEDVTPVEDVELSTRYQRAKLHVQTNKKVYLVGGGCLIAGIVIRGHVSNVTLVLNNTPRNGGFLFRSTQIMNNTVVQTLVRKGHPGKKIYWVEGRTWFSSYKGAAIAANVSKSSVARCARGLAESVKGQHFIDGGDMI